MNYVLHNADCQEAMHAMAENSVDAIITDPPYGICFMGRKWDYKLPPSDIWAEALRVAKPGAYMLVFGGTRTFHRLACSIEDIGWEIRDCIMWVYSTGFPKSMNLAKAIDKHHGYMSQEASAWKGWGTCLKPAYEPIIVARKAIEGTVAANILKYGTGAINIDACRVPTRESWKHGKSSTKPRGEFGGNWKRIAQCSNNKGRFPANLVHDGSAEVLAAFPDSKGQCGAIKGNEPSELTRGIFSGFSGNRLPCYPRKDSGSAARFFYCAKASRSERGEGNVHPTVKPLALMRWLITLVASTDAVVLDPFMGSGTTGVAAVELGRSFIGIERDSEYFAIAQNRMAAADRNKTGR